MTRKLNRTSWSFLALLTLLLVTVGIVFAAAKPLSGRVVSRVLTRRIGTPVEVRIQYLSLSEAGFSLRLASPPLFFEGLRLRWQIHSLRRGLLTAHLSAREPRTSVGPIELRDSSLEAGWERSSELDWKVSVELRVREVISGQSGVTQTALLFELDPRRLRLHIDALDSSRKKISAVYEAPGLPSMENAEEILFAGRIQARHPWATVRGPVTLVLSRSGGFRSLDGKFDQTVEWVNWPKDLTRTSESSIKVARTGDTTEAKIELGLGGRTLIRAQGEQNSETGKASATFALDWPLDWKKGKKIAPFLKAWLADASGTLAMSGRLEGRPGQYRTSGILDLRNLTFSPGGIAIRGMTGKFELASLWPVVAPRQKLTIARLGSSIPVENFSAFLEIQRGERLVVDTLAAGWAGGTVKAARLEADFEAGKGSTRIELGHVDLTAVLKADPKQKLQAKGTVSGHVPLQWEGGELHIDDAELHSDGPGWLRYGALSGAQADAKILELGEFQRLMDQGQQALVFKALDNFFFDQLSLKVKRTSGTDLTALAELRGRNPDLARMPFQFNVNISGQLEAALRQTAMRLFVNPEAFWQNPEK